MKNILFGLIMLLAITSTALEQSGVRSAVYEVPAVSSDLGSARFFPIKQMNLKQGNGQMTMKYLIPVELTGAENFIQFSGPVGGNQTCVKSVSEVTCRVKYQNLRFDQAKVDFQLKNKFTGLELSQRQQVQREFSGDPVGIIHIKF